MRGNTERLAAMLRPIAEAIHPPESMRRVRRINAALDEEGRATEYALASSLSSSGGAGVSVQNNDALIADDVDVLDFSSAFDVTESPTGEANISPVFGTSAGEFAEGDHTHAGGGTTITVQEGDVTSSATVDTLDFDTSDFNVSISPAGEANVTLNYGTTAGTPAEGNHTHTSALAVYEGVTLKSASVSAIVFDASDFNVVDTGGSEEVTLQYGTGANQPAEGNHTHSGVYQPVDTELTAIAGLTSAADKAPYFTGSGTAALADLTAAGRALIDDADAAAQRTTLGLVAGGAGDVWVEKAGDTITGDLDFHNVSLRLFSDAGTTRTMTLQGNTGYIYFGTIAVTNASIKAGTGSPEGVVSSQVGSLWLRTDGGANTAVYRKESGTGNTGWVAVSAASGGTITVQEGDATVDAAVTTLDFDASDFNVTSSPAGEANVALAYGTTAGTPAEGNHTHALDDLSDVALSSPRNGSVVAFDGSSWADRMVYNFVLGPFYINDLPGTATTQATLGYFNTATAVSRATNDIKMARSGYIVGAFMTSDAARTAGTATLRVRISGADTAFDAGGCVLDATNTTSHSDIVASTLGVSFSSGQTIGVNVTTSGWTPTTADLSVWLLVQINPFD